MDTATTPSPIKKKAANKSKTASKKKNLKAPSTKGSGNINYPKHSFAKSLRIPKAIIEQNAGKECSESESAKFVGVGYGGPFQVEISSAKKYGLLERTGPKKIRPTELAKKIIRPQSSEDELDGVRESVINAPILGDVYKHYRGENLPDRTFFENALADTFKVPADRISEFIEVFTDSLSSAKLLEKVGDKQRVIDISSSRTTPLVDSTDEIKKLAKSVFISSGDSCFVMMPFASPLGEYYQQIYEPAIKKTGLTPLRADNDIFGTGKIIDQIWNGISSAKVLIAELTQRNPNVYYELGIAHALKKPVVLVCSNEEDVPFDLKHIRVIYYNMHDPFWGEKLIDKVAENILSAIKNPIEAILFK
ncbi:hypothetical protein [Lacibacter sp. H407]|uniref:hypothetical protein n=1 Tax=Lacibacter sp. H407 TaxID=3133423 RepID=UPI0030BAD34A